MSLAVTGDECLLPHNLPPSDRARSVGDIELPSMKRRTKPVTLHNYRNKKLLEDRLVNSSVQVSSVHVYKPHEVTLRYTEKPIGL